MKDFGKPFFGLDFYLNVMDLPHAFQSDNKNYKNKFDEKCVKLNKSIAELINNFNILSYYPLCIESKFSVSNLAINIDKSNGYQYSTSVCSINIEVFYR